MWLNEWKNDLEASSSRTHTRAFLIFIFMSFIHTGPPRPNRLPRTPGRNTQHPLLTTRHSLERLKTHNTKKHIETIFHTLLPVHIWIQTLFLQLPWRTEKHSFNHERDKELHTWCFLLQNGCLKPVKPSSVVYSVQAKINHTLNWREDTNRAISSKPNASIQIKYNPN